ncbi:MAG: hypothetical protein VX346_07790 [Planctomycetota bacterium]|nr:hypothetical protein [Planctomycetota bacterium]
MIRRKLGDTIEINADATHGMILAEALDNQGKVIATFSKQDCTPVTGDSVRHVAHWTGASNCQLIQACPVKLRFHLKNAKLYSFTPRVRHKYCHQSYD